ncbi:hypothetical protein QCA50_000046 [Cerrena zonata]|uniref:Glucose-6-phosphate 1-dehydrogenase n=1 Tax=Cerrena zonata TaxID=2478898 RepID=A0AAW0GZ91_9APHY
MDLTYKRRFADAKIPEAYESLILDALKGDHSNFVRDDELDVAWKIFTPILHWIEGKSGPWSQASPLPIWLSRTQRTRRFHSEVRLQTWYRRICLASDKCLELVIVSLPLALQFFVASYLRSKPK